MWYAKMHGTNKAIAEGLTFGACSDEAMKACPWGNDPSGGMLSMWPQNARLSGERKMADMVDAGMYTFEAWARQTPSPAYGFCWENRWLGDFNPHMTAEEAGTRLGSDKLTQQGQQAFKRGWERAQAEYLAKLTPNAELSGKPATGETQ